jgi:uncharacterized cupin superfamily protein
MVEEARLEERPEGRTAVTDGWFVLNVRDGPWVKNERFGAACIFEGDDDAPFAQIGFTLAVLQPGCPNGMYHREANQEDFLVLEGECLLLIEGEELRLGPWDFVHCPADTDHILIGAGTGPCIVFMTGSRVGWPAKGIVYPRSERALEHGAGVEKETTRPAEAYAPHPKWLPGRPDNWYELPWSE